MRVSVSRHPRFVVTQFLSSDGHDNYCALNERGTTMMNDLKRTPYTGVDRRAPRGDAPSGGNREASKTGGRHAAITTSLYNWHSYKNWAEKARGNFDEKK
jgi:hypothetical protein